MAIDEPGRLGDGSIGLPFEFEIDLGVFGILILEHGLLVGALQVVAGVDGPDSRAIGFVFLELAGEGGGVGEHPFTLDNLIVVPDSNQFHPRVGVGVGTLAFFLAELPPPRVGVLVLVEVGAFAVFHPVFPLSWVRAAVP